MKQILFLSILFIMITGQLFAGGGWTPEKGSGFVKLSQSMLLSDQFFSPAGDLVDITTTGIYSSSIYGELGITDRFTVIAYFPFFSRATLNRKETPEGELIEEGDHLNSLGDADLTFKYGLIQQKPLVLSASLTLGLPLGTNGGGRTGLLQTGDGEFNQMLTLEASHSFYPQNFYLSGLIGFNNRTNNFSDEIRYGLEIGFTPGKFIGVLRFYGVKPLMNGNDELLPINGVFNNNVEFLAVTPEINYMMTEKWGISLSFGGAFYGKNILANPNLVGGLFYDF
ncbi:MAG: hypothetical protein ACNS62_18095 [Candidatus Cyclobacteriaceae bacterium M3_2C_046]